MKAKEQQAATAQEVNETSEETAAFVEEAPQTEAQVADAHSIELEGLRKLAEENHERYLRAQADFDNFRRRSRLEKEDFAKYASVKLIEQLLPIVDNFERALAAGQQAKDFEALLKGIEMTAKQLQQVLEQEGLQVIETVGQPFNPEVHQAIMQVESEMDEEGIIVEEIQKGYILKEKVIRPAMVKVSM